MTNQSIKENLKNEKSKSTIDEPNIKKNKKLYWGKIYQRRKFPKRILVTFIETKS